MSNTKEKFSDKIREEYIGEKWFKCPVMETHRTESTESPLQKLDKFNWFKSSSYKIILSILLILLPFL